jgi:hypothetical protein
MNITLDERDKKVQMLVDFFIRKQHSFKACYQDITGDMRVTGVLRDSVHMRAAIDTTTFSIALADALNRVMVQEYNTAGLDTWKKIVNVVSARDFRTRRCITVGGYSNLPTVAQGANYTALVTPGDVEATYAITKKGGTEDITLEAIKNDDVDVIRRVPVKLGRAAARTLYNFVFDLLKNNAAIYDAVALFHAGHNNLGIAALDKPTLLAGRLAMMKQTEADSGEQLDIPPCFLIVSPDLEDTAYELTAQPNLAGFTPNAPDAVRRQTWEVIPVKNWTDTNNWFLAADPKDIPSIEMSFLDGREEPEVFIQDQPNMGSMFSNDKLTYKIRHIYGGAVTNFRGLYGAIVP